MTPSNARAGAVVWRCLIASSATPATRSKSMTAISPRRRKKEVHPRPVRLPHNRGAKLYTNDYTLGKIAELQKVNYVNLHDLAKSLRVILLPGEVLTLRIVREGT